MKDLEISRGIYRVDRKLSFAFLATLQAHCGYVGTCNCFANKSSGMINWSLSTTPTRICGRILFFSFQLIFRLTKSQFLPIAFSTFHAQLPTCLANSIFSTLREKNNCFHQSYSELPTSTVSSVFNKKSDNGNTERKMFRICNYIRIEK